MMGQQPVRAVEALAQMVGELAVMHQEQEVVLKKLRVQAK